MGIELTFRDPVLEEGGTNEWAAWLRERSDWSLRTAGTLLAVRGRADLAADLQRRVENLYAAAVGYEKRLKALEDQRRVQVQGIVAQYRQAFGDVDRNAMRLMGLCQGISRVWTLRMEGHTPETAEDLAEAIDWARFMEDHGKCRARGEIQRQATELVEHVRLLTRLVAGTAISATAREVLDDEKEGAGPSLTADRRDVCKQARKWVIETAGNGAPELIGESDAILQVWPEIAKAAECNYPVLILGERGTGKEIVARMIHLVSKRSAGKLEVVNCAGLKGDLVSSELFGHEEGAFTGATRSRKGRLELAEGGTLFLDEIGHLPLETQSMLLRVTQDGDFRPVGGTFDMKADVRIVAATNRDLHAARAKGEFLPDLYDRLAQLEIRMPPLRERGNDAVLLAEHLAHEEGYVVPGEQLKRIVAGDSWDSNVRGLQKAVRNWLLQHPETRKKPAAVSPEGPDKATIEEALRNTRGNVSRAAERTDMPRSTLRDAMDKHGVRADDFRPKSRR